VCQLHGGDIGVSSKEGEGSTFGFFFKVRRSDGTSDGRPPFQFRSNSEASQSSSREKAAHPARPSYGRANSNLAQIKERNNERPEAKTLTSHSGVTLDEANGLLNKSLINPPTEFIAESHPQASSDERFEATEKIARDIEPQAFHLRKATDVNMIDLEHGETERQENIADDTSRSQRNQRADEKQTLLLVEDNLINQRVLRRQLQSRGFEVFIANNGQEAIDAVAERGKYSDLKPNDRNYFDCVLMDQEMPVKDGNVATQEIRALQQQGKAGYSHILGVSANVREAQTQSMRDAGMDDIISKPFKVDDLVKRIRSIILEDGGQGDASKHGRNNGPPAIENAEVRMLEDLPPKDNREGSEQTRVNSEHGRPEKSGSRGKGSRESGGRARIELGGNAQEDRSTRNANSAEGGKGTTTSWQEDKGLRDGRREMREEQDRKDGEKGKRSGREGEARGGERSRERHDK
jgi:CheY-like chemotaxis protein